PSPSVTPSTAVAPPVHAAASHAAPAAAERSRAFLHSFHPIHAALTAGGLRDHIRLPESPRIGPGRGHERGAAAPGPSSRSPPRSRAYRRAGRARERRTRLKSGQIPGRTGGRWGRSPPETVPDTRRLPNPPG